jgi:multicomponent Na+:H+ antiporter subunit D
MIAEALAGLVFLPLLAACAAGRAAAPVAGRARAAGPAAAAAAAGADRRRGGAHGRGPACRMAGFERPLGIVWRVDPLAATLLGSTPSSAIVVGAYAPSAGRPPAEPGRRFWSLWLLLIAAMNALLLSADLFNLFVTLELVTLAAIGLLVLEGKPAALRAAMRYLLLALLARCSYLLGVALIYGQAGTLDLYQAGELLERDCCR